MFGALNPDNSLSKQPFGGIIAQNWSLSFIARPVYSYKVI